MLKQNQISHATAYNRYPKIFKEIKKIIPSPSQILSFGCSTGLECETLQKLYFPNIKIIGLDISEEVIEKNKKKINIRILNIIQKVDNITGKSDLIFANSVLCRWPERMGEYTFETFENTLELIDSLLNKNGYIIIQNIYFVKLIYFLIKNMKKLRHHIKKQDL